ncbi:MAG: arsenical pump-driving ATPase [Planctomycetales bacterium]|jgi:arsenite-transporting ATPase|nr:arsenical pump-driving ATPase [Planctomycetales bacterium]
MKFLDSPTRNLFFTGKGGVGKTTLASVAAIFLVDAGKKVLLVSTDPASNLDDVLGSMPEHHPTPVPSMPGLSAMNLDPQKMAAEYRERMVGPYRSQLPATAIASMEEQFSGSCTLEIAAFDEFARLLGDASATLAFDHVIFDTAPTGHTLRLLTLPSAWSGFIEKNTTGTSCLGPLAGLQTQQKLYQDTVSALSDASITTLVLVTRPEMTALREAARTSSELAALGVQNQRLVVNGVFQAGDRSDRLAVAMQQRGEAAVSAMPEALRDLPRSMFPLTTDGVLGITALRAFGTHTSTVAGTSVPPTLDFTMPSTLEALIDGLAAPGHGVILAMGKGGVGKTTVAAAVAVGLAECGFHVLLSTTDPAAHLAATIAGDALPNLSVRRIDPAVEAKKYSEDVMRSAGVGLDLEGQELLAEDLRSPCTTEIAVFRAFAETVGEGTNGFVVLDTAPTGHSILLLDATLAYHREVLRQTSDLPESVAQLLPRLRDPHFSRVLIVTLPEATPIHEAAQLQHDLRRAEIEPYAWVINQSLLPLNVTDPVLCGRQSHEVTFLREVITKHAQRSAIIPWQIKPPVGHQALRQLVRASTSLH